MGAWDGMVSASGGYAGGRAHEVDDEAIDRRRSRPTSSDRGAWLARPRPRWSRGGAGGRIVIVASRAAVDVARGQAAYQVSKAAVLRLAQVMAAELQGHGITVNAVLPGTMDTPANREEMPKANRVTWVSTDSVAAVIEWLLSDDAAAVTGAAIPAG